MFFKWSIFFGIIQCLGGQYKKNIQLCTFLAILFLYAKKIYYIFVFLVSFPYGEEDLFVEFFIEEASSASEISGLEIWNLVGALGKSLLGVKIELLENDEVKQTIEITTLLEKYLIYTSNSAVCCFLFFTFMLPCSKIIF